MRSPMLYKVPLVLTPQPEGGYTVTSPVLPELLTEGDIVEECIDHARDALAAVVEAYEELGWSLPFAIQVNESDDPLSVETLVTAQ